MTSAAAPTGTSVTRAAAGAAATTGTAVTHPQAAARQGQGLDLGLGPNRAVAQARDNGDTVPDTQGEVEGEAILCQTRPQATTPATHPPVRMAGEGERCVAAARRELVKDPAQTNTLLS